MCFTTLQPASLSFLPSDKVMEVYKKDYETMKERMIYREAGGFDMLIKKPEGLNYNLNRQ